MLRFDEWNMPDGEKHLPELMAKKNDRRHGRLTYQAHKYDMAMQFVGPRRLAVDVGAHVGLWSFLMVHDFEQLIAFEPMKEHAACWQENMKELKIGRAPRHAKLYGNALGAYRSMVDIATRTKGSSGDTAIVPHASGEIPMLPLDDFELKDVDFMKIDCEGYELPVLQGARQTLQRCKPCVIVEQKRNMSMTYGIPTLAAVEYLESLGATRRADFAGDYVLSW